MAIYAYIDVSQKQEYIYKNSKLIDNLYNSFIIKAVTEKLDIQELSSEDINEKIVYLSEYLKKLKEEDYKFIYSGGGNSIIRFEDEEKAVEFVKGYSFEILKNYPDLELYISLVDENKIDCNENKVIFIRKKLINKLDELKDKRKTKFKRLTYGIEEIGENGQAIEIPFEKEMKKSKEFHKKLVRRYLFNKFDKKLNDIAIITEELQKYKKDEKGKSYIGVISIDGNAMGKMVNNITNFYELENLSKIVDEIYFDAIVEALKEYKERVKSDSLIITPVLQAGDDICLIVEAEHAIEITAAIIKKIEEISQRVENINGWNKFAKSDYLTACGGIAIVRYTYPFFEAIKIAENLCHRAKESVYLVETMREDGQQNSFIDWEIVQSQVDTGIEYETYVKNRNYKEKYHIKPLRVDQSKALEDSVFSYNAFCSMVKGIQEEVGVNISSSFLEELKKQIYNGVEQYKLFLDMNEKEKKFLSKLMEEIFYNIECNDDNYYEYFYYYDDPTYTYVFNDVLEALPFVSKSEVK